MKILVAKHKGFCSGVRMVVDLAIKESKKHPIYTLGPLLHNNQFAKELENMGIKIIKNINEANGRLIVSRSHGVPLEILKKAESENIPLIEGTCPFVKHAQSIARELKERGYKVFIIGNREHSEVIGIDSFTGYDSIIINSVEEAENLGKYDRIGIVSQTTQNKHKFNKIVEELRKHCNEIRVVDTICNVTKQRQDEAAEIAKKADVMVIIGGKHSSNTCKLFNICRKYANSYHIETADELSLSWFKNAEKVGVTAGASTPDYVIGEVIQRIKKI